MPERSEVNRYWWVRKTPGRQRKQSRRNSMRFRVKRTRVGNHVRFKVEEGFFRSEEIQICCSGENSYLLGRGPGDNQERRYKWRCRQDIKLSAKWCSRVPEIKIHRHSIISLTEKEGGAYMCMESVHSCMHSSIRTDYLRKIQKKIITLVSSSEIYLQCTLFYVVTHHCSSELSLV